MTFKIGIAYAFVMLCVVAVGLFVAYLLALFGPDYFPQVSQGHGQFVGTLVGSLFGFLAVAASAFIGIHGAMAANRHQIEAQHAAEKESEARRLKEERKRLAAGLQAELGAIKHDLEGWHDAVVILTDNMDAKIARLPGGLGIYDPGAPAMFDHWPAILTPYYDARVGRVDILGRTLCTAVVMGYALVTAWRSMKAVDVHWDKYRDTLVERAEMARWQSSKLLPMAIEALEIGQRDDYDPTSTHDVIAKRIHEIRTDINPLGASSEND